MSQDISFLDKAIVYGFYGTDVINKMSYGQVVPENHHEQISNYKETIEKILDQEKCFEELYIINLKSIYMHILQKTDSDKQPYMDMYEKEQHHAVIRTHHYFQYTYFKQVPIEHGMVQKEILEGNEELLLQYCQITDNNDSEIINFLEHNLDFIYQNSFVLLSYIKKVVQQNIIPKSEIVTYLTSHKYDSFESLLAYIKLLRSQSKTISPEDIKQLMKFASYEKEIYIRISETLGLLKELGKTSDYLTLALNKEKEYQDVISYTLELCYQDTSLFLDDFNQFIANIVHIENYYAMIGEIYIKFNDYKSAFDFFIKEYDENSKENPVLFRILEIALKHFHKSANIYKKVKQQEVYNLILTTKDDLSFHDANFLFQYSMSVLKDTKQILPFLNQLILKEDIKNLDENLKIELSNLFIQKFHEADSESYEKLFIYDENTCFVKDSQTYIKNSYSILKENISHIGFIMVDENDFFVMSQDKTFSKESLFHKIVGVFAFKVNNPSFIMMRTKEDSDNPLEELFSFIDEVKQNDILSFEQYTNEKDVGLYSLAKHEYRNYFTLIPYLLNHEKYCINSMKPNIIPKKKKILTLSSIVFLNHIGYLNNVLERGDIVIQQTLINWLKNYIDNFNYSMRTHDYIYLDEDNDKPTFIPFTEEEAKKADDFKQKIIDLTTKLLKYEIIDDTAATLQIENAFDILAKGIGSQEYHALAYCLQHNYQIISENNIFEFLFDELGSNKVFISNSVAFLRNILKQDEMFKLEQELHQKKYKYLVNCLAEEKLIEFLNYPRLYSVLNKQFIFWFQLWYEYGCLDKILHEYNNKYKV